MEGNLQSNERIFNILQWFAMTTFLLFVAENYSTVFLIYKLDLEAAFSMKAKYEKNNRGLVTS